MKQEHFNNEFKIQLECPAFWELEARRLKHSGDLLFDAANRDVAKLFKGIPPQDLDNLDISPYAMMLYGLSIENLTKGILIQDKPNLKSKLLLNGKLRLFPGSEPDGHNLIGLCKEAGIKLNDDLENIVKRLESFVRWAGRYPVPRHPKNMAFSPPLPLVSSAERAIFDDFYKSLESMIIKKFSKALPLSEM